MNAKRTLFHVLFQCILILGLLTPFIPTSVAHAGTYRFAYVYSTDTASLAAWQAFITSKGYLFDAVSIMAAQTYDFTVDRAILIGQETSITNATTVANIVNSAVSVIGLYNGGATFLQSGGFTNGNPHMMSDTLSGVAGADPNADIWYFPNVVNPIQIGGVQLYTSSNPVTELYAPTPQPYTTLIGRSPKINDLHYPITAQRPTPGAVCYWEWGFQGAPNGMTTDGKNLFSNILSAPNTCMFQYVTYVYNSDSSGLAKITTLLRTYNIITFAIPKSNLSLLTSYPGGLAVILAPDLNPITATADINLIKGYGAPIIGMGYPGYKFFGTLGLGVGYPNGALSSGSTAYMINNNFGPLPVNSGNAGSFSMYTTSGNVEQIFFKNMTSLVTYQTVDPNNHFYANTIYQKNSSGCYIFWGYSSSPANLTANGGLLLTDYVMNPCQ